MPKNATKTARLSGKKRRGPVKFPGILDAAAACQCRYEHLYMGFRGQRRLSERIHGILASKFPALSAAAAEGARKFSRKS